MRIFLAALAMVLVAPAALRSDARSSAVEIANAVQTRYEGVRDFSADFVHTYEGGVLRRKAVERGTVLIKRPGRMRWTYTSPEEKIFVSDGRQIYSYIPADKQVIVSPMPEGDQATAPVLFLVGRGHLTRDFVVSFAGEPEADADTYALELVPRRPEREYDRLRLVVERPSLRLRELSAVDAQGGTSTFVFSNLRENIGLADRAFAFTIPRGVDVIRTDEGR
jgi:outer membrane lipoprotein carrier protein